MKVSGFAFGVFVMVCVFVECMIIVDVWGVAMLVLMVVSSGLYLVTLFGALVMYGCFGVGNVCVLVLCIVHFFFYVVFVVVVGTHG